MNTAKLATAAGTALSALAAAAELPLVAAVERDFPAAANAVVDPWNADWAHLPSTRPVWSESLERFVDVNWRNENYHWYLRVCAFELLRTDREGDNPAVRAGVSPSRGPNPPAAAAARPPVPYEPTTGPVGAGSEEIAGMSAFFATAGA